MDSPAGKLFHNPCDFSKSQSFSRMGLKIETYKPLFGHRKKPNFPLTNAKYSQRKGRALLDHHCDECFKQFHTCQFAEAVGDCSFYVSSFGSAFGFLEFLALAL